MLAEITADEWWLLGAFFMLSGIVWLLLCGVLINPLIRFIQRAVERRILSDWERKFGKEPGSEDHG